MRLFFNTPTARFSIVVEDKVRKFVRGIIARAFDVLLIATQDYKRAFRHPRRESVNTFALGTKPCDYTAFTF
jgi:hypothetical protein